MLTVPRRVRQKVFLEDNMGFTDDQVNKITLSVRDGAVYADEDLLGEWDGGEFVPSNLLLRSAPSFQKWVDTFARNQKNSLGGGA
jgi:hypothetical protein